jgi:serine protease Do
LRIGSALFFAVLVACGDPTPQGRASAQTPDTAARNPSAPALHERGVLSDSISRSRYSAIAMAAELVAPSVVSVNVVRRVRQRARTAWDFLFTPPGAEREVQGLGSGFIISTGGLVITNQHVTAGAQEIVVTTREGVDYEATLLGEDPLTDIAVLQIDSMAAACVVIGSSETLMIGEWVVAIGNPYGYLLGNAEPSVTAGVVSAVGRNLLPSSNDRSIYVGMIQTDAAINPGNSGGPLVNAIGEVVGVNSSIFSESGGSVGIGFAIPIERALRIADELQLYGSVRRSWVGLSVPGRDRLGDWKRTGGLPVTAVAPDSPAEDAGLREGDVLLTAAGRTMRTFLDWESVKLDVAPSQVLELTYRRNGQERRATVAVANLPTAVADKVEVLGEMRLVTVTPAVRQERDLETEQGALIFDIGAAAQRSTGLRSGDVIYQINRQRVTSADDVPDIIRDVARRGAVRIYFERGGSHGYTDFYVR